jgi:hypothetical protein
MRQILMTSAVSLMRFHSCEFNAIPLLCDNESTIKLGNNPVQQFWTKHIDIRHYFLRDYKAKGDIALLM